MSVFRKLFTSRGKEREPHSPIESPIESWQLLDEGATGSTLFLPTRPTGPKLPPRLTPFTLALSPPVTAILSSSSGNPPNARAESSHHVPNSTLRPIQVGPKTQEKSHLPFPFRDIRKSAGSYTPERRTAIEETRDTPTFERSLEILLAENDSIDYESLVRDIAIHQVRHSISRNILSEANSYSVSSCTHLHTWCFAEGMQGELHLLDLL
jgi:hypothetical protein